MRTQIVSLIFNTKFSNEIECYENGAKTVSIGVATEHIEAKVVFLYWESNWTFSSAKTEWFFHTQIHTRPHLDRLWNRLVHISYLFVCVSVADTWNTHSIERAYEQKKRTPRRLLFLLHRIDVQYFLFI